MFLELARLGIEKIEQSKFSEAENLRRLDLMCSIAGVNQQLGFIGYSHVIIVAVIRDDDYAVISAQVLELRTGQVD